MSRTALALNARWEHVEMGLLGSKETDDALDMEAPAPGPVSNPRGRGVQILGRQFGIVPEGLDPQQVMDFMESIAGSSEAAFKRLEQFLAFQTFATTMNDSITEARELAERAKAQAALEAQQEKARAVSEAGREIADLLEQVRSRCMDSLDHTFTTLQVALDKAREADKLSLEKANETIAKARQIERQALEKAQETSRQVRDFEEAAFEKARASMSANLAGIETMLQEAMETRGDAGTDPPAGEHTAPDPTLAAGDAEKASESAVEEDRDLAPDPEAEADPPMDEFGGPMSDGDDLRDEETFSGDGYAPLADAPATSCGEVEDENVSADGVPPDDAADAEADGAHLYSGAVTVRVPGGVDEAWARHLRHAVKGIPGARVREEAGGDTTAFTMSLVLQEPAALSDVLAGLPDVERVLERRRTDNQKRQVLRFRPGGLSTLGQSTLVVELTHGSRAKREGSTSAP